MKESYQYFNLFGKLIRYRVLILSTDAAIYQYSLN